MVSIFSRLRFMPGTVSTRPSKEEVIWNSLKRQATTQPVVALERPTWSLMMTGVVMALPSRVWVMMSKSVSRGAAELQTGTLMCTRPGNFSFNRSELRSSSTASSSSRSSAQQPRPASQPSFPAHTSHNPRSGLQDLDPWDRVERVAATAPPPASAHAPGGWTVFPEPTAPAPRSAWQSNNNNAFSQQNGYRPKKSQSGGDSAWGPTGGTLISPAGSPAGTPGQAPGSQFSSGFNPGVPSPRHTPSSTPTRLSQPSCTVLYDFEPENAGELGFKEGDTIILKQKVDDNWFEGSFQGKTGFFPINYVNVVIPLP